MSPSTINLPHILSISWTIRTSYHPSSIITYNLAIGVSASDLSLVYEGHPNFHALPTFGSLPVIAIMGKVTRSMAEFLPGFQGHNHVHGEHFLELKQEFPTGTGPPGEGRDGRKVELETEARVVDIVAKRSGVLVIVGITTWELLDGGRRGEEVCYNEWTSFVLEVPGKGASEKVEARGAATRLYPAPDRPADKVVVQKTSQEQGALYRAASGDLNPLHIDPEVAKKGGFEGPILTGTCTLGMGVRHVIEAFGEGRRFKNVRLRLSKPVFPGKEVRTEMWKEDGGRRIVYRQSVGSRIVMRDAAVEFEDIVLKEESDRGSLLRAVGAKL